MKKILLPTDGSVECQKALDIAENMAKSFDGVITVYNVFFDKSHYKRQIPDIENYTVRNTEMNKEMVQKTVDYFKNKGVDCESKIVIGDPASSIIDEAETGDYDLVIMCTHGMSATKRFLLGSVTNKVVHHIKVPLLIVR